MDTRDTREAEIRAAAIRARAAAPSFQIPEEVFVAHLRERLGAEAPVSEIHLEDLYLACACLHGDQAAWRELDRAHLSRVPAFVSRIDASKSFGEEIRQRLAEKLVAQAPGEAGESGSKLALYSGRGSLGGWLRVAAVREAHNVRRGHRPQEQSEVDIVDHGDDPEVKLAKQRYAAAFKVAFQEVLAGLSSDRRNVLRLHYLDGLTLDEVGRAYGVSRATAARWIADARDAILSKLRTALVADLGRNVGGPASILAYVQSQLDLSLQRHFSFDDEGPLSDGGDSR